MNVEIYCDGSNEKSDGSGDGGYGIVFISGNVRKEISGWIPSPCTNNKAEFLALLAALRELKFPCNLKIHSDSQLVIMYFYHLKGRRWKRKSKDLYDISKEIDNYLKQHEYVLIHVHGHSGNYWNDRTHELANLGRRTKQTVSTYHSLV